MHLPSYVLFSCWVCICFFFFFFQAEDGIRDGHVTGVQTCALPISESGCEGSPRPGCTNRRWCPVCAALRTRSEERRVGKECRCRLSADHQKKKKEREARRKCVDN